MYLLNLLFFFLWTLPIVLLVDWPLQALRRSRWGQRMWPATSPWAKGVHEPVQSEITQNIAVGGSGLPADFPSGAFVRNGPNPRSFHRGDLHWFDGDGMLHSVAVGDSRTSVTFRNRYVRTQRWMIEDVAQATVFTKAADILTPRGFILFLVQAIVKRVWARLTGDSSPPKRLGTANTALAYHDRRVLALVESDAPYHVLAPQLETVKRLDYDGRLSHPFTAHPKIDPETGEMIFFGYQFDSAPYCSYSVVSPDGQLKLTLPITLDVPVMMHDFAATKRYSILLDLPLTFRAARAFRGKSVLSFEPERRSRFGILPRYAASESAVVWFETRACYIFHTANAYEEGDKVILFAFRSNKTNVGSSNWKAEFNDPEAFPVLYRFEFDMSTRTVSEHACCTLRGEFPVIDPTASMKKNRYVFFSHGSNADKALSEGMDALVRFDTETSAIDVIQLPPNLVCGEAVFVPRVASSASGTRREGDGFLTTFLYHTTNNSSAWVVYDAHTMSSEPLALVPLPQRVPLGFHGLWVSKEELLAQRTA